MSGQPWFLPSRTTSLAVEPTSSQRLTKVWDWQIGTSVSASPWMISMGGMFECTK